MEENFNAQKKKQGNIGWYYFVFGILILGLCTFILKLLLVKEPEIDAKILKNEIYINENLLFSDNTKNSEKWLWEFGNGDISDKKSGSYNYDKAGSYIIRLTVNNNLKLEFPVNVKDTIRKEIDNYYNITGPTYGVVNEEIRLEGNGEGKEFEWWFGETGRVDVRGKTAFYTYRAPGKYMVRFKSDKSSKPIYHELLITDPTAILIDELVTPGDAERFIIDDIKAKLQAIANGADFNSNYYYLIKNYFCNNEKALANVNINGKTKQFDFYSYCMGLTFAQKVIIENINVQLLANSSCISTLNIIQQSPIEQMAQNLNSSENY